MDKIVIYDPSFQLTFEKPLRHIVRETPNGVPVGVPSVMPFIGPIKLSWFKRQYYKLIRRGIVVENYIEKRNDQDLFKEQLEARKKADADLQTAIEAAKQSVITRFDDLPKHLRTRKYHGFCVSCHQEDFLYHGKRCNPCHKVFVKEHIDAIRIALAKKIAEKATQ